MKNTIAVAIILLSVAGGVLFYMRGCHSGPSPETAAAIQRADSAQHELDSLKTVTLPQIAQLCRDTAAGNRRYDSLRRADSSVRVDIYAGIAAVKENLTAGDAAAARHDTAAILINWDSLRAQVKAGLPIVIKHDTLDMEQILACEANGRVKDSLAAGWERLYHAADTANTFQKKAFAGLQKDFNRQQFALKIWKPVAIGGVAYTVLSIVIHSLKK